MRDIDMCFRQAMMTEVDEIRHGEHLHMVYVEFIEAIARIADQLYPDKKNETYSLKNKLESLMPLLVEICPQKVLNSFDFPSDAAYHNMKYKKKIITVKEIINPK